MSTTFVEHKRVYGSTYVPHYRNGMDEIIEVFDIPSFLLSYQSVAVVTRRAKPHWSNNPHLLLLLRRHLHLGTLSLL